MVLSFVGGGLMFFAALVTWSLNHHARQAAADEPPAPMRWFDALVGDLPLALVDHPDPAPADLAHAYQVVLGGMAVLGLVVLGGGLWLVYLGRGARGGADGA